MRSNIKNILKCFLLSLASFDVSSYFEWNFDFAVLLMCSTTITAVIFCDDELTYSLTFEAILCRRPDRKSFELFLLCKQRLH